MKPSFFTSQTKFRQWLEKNHDKKSELLVGFHKKASGKKSITYQEALDEALAFGWIDGVRRGIDDDSYTIRFTPRKLKSIWSLVNTKRVDELTKLGRMKPAGLKAFALRDPKRTARVPQDRHFLGNECQTRRDAIKATCPADQRFGQRYPPRSYCHLKETV